MASYSPTPSPHPPHSSRRQPQSNLGSSVASSLSANSNAAKTASTEEAIVVQLFSKAAQVVVQGRIDASPSSSNPNSSSKTNKWFNLETVEVDPLRSELKFWKSLISTQPTQLLPMILDVYLDVSHVHNSDQHLVLKDETSLRRQRIPTDSLVGSSLDPITGASVAIKKNRILLESWQLTLLQPAPSFPPETAVMYKKCVMFFRSLYTHVRLLPAYRLFRRIKKPSESGTANLLKIGYRLSSSRVMPMDEAGLDQLHTKDSRNGITEYNFGALETTMGIINMHVMYRTECDFTLSDPEPLFGAPADLETNYFYSQSHESRQNSFLRQQHADDPLYQPPSLSNSNRRISAPSRPFGTSVSNRANVSVLGSSPRSFGGTGNRASLPNTSHPGALPLPVQRVGPPSVSGASATGGISPAFTLSGSFPRSYGAQKSGLTDAIAMGLFDGVQQGLPFSVGRSSTGGPDEQKENDRKSFEDVFARLEESPPFDVFLDRDTSKPRYGTSVSSNHSTTSNTSLTHRQSITFPRTQPSATHTIPFTTTILNRRSDASKLAVALIPRTSSGLPILPGTTPPRAPFSTSLSNPQILATVPVGPFGAQTPPPFVTMMSVGKRTSMDIIPGTSFGSGGSTSAASVMGELGDFLKGVDNRRRSLILRPKSSAGSIAEGSEENTSLQQKKKTSRNQSLSRFKQLKDSYQDFSNSLTAATGVHDKPPLVSRSSTPPPVLLSNTPPSTQFLGGPMTSHPPIVSGTSPKTSHPSPRVFTSPLTAEPLTNTSVTSTTSSNTRTSIPTKSIQSHRPSSLQHVTVLSTVLSDSGTDSQSSASNTVPTAQLPTGSPISEEPSLHSISTRDKHPQNPPTPPSVVQIPVRKTHRPQNNIYVADPARVSAGFFPISDRTNSGSSAISDETSSTSTGGGAGTTVIRVQSPALAIEPLGMQSTVPSSSLSTSLRSTKGLHAGGPTTSNFGVAPRAMSAERPPQPPTVLPRRNSSSGGISAVTVSEGGYTGRVGKLSSGSAQSAPMEVPLAKRNIRGGGRIDNTWDHEEESSDDD